MIGVGTFRVTPKMRRLVDDVLDSGRISYGPMSRSFEQRFAALHECKHAVLSNSGTDSLRIALAALKERHGWQAGDEVILPATTFVATLNIILQNRLRPVLVDVDPVHYELDPEKLTAAITRRTRAIIPVHLFGQPCSMALIASVASAYGLKIIEDSCECMFVSHHGRRVGSWGDVGCFSTYVAHLLTTGVGGIATTNDPDLAVLMRSLVNHGRDSIYISIDDGRDATGQKLVEVIGSRFRFERIGYSARITELEAALGLGQLDDEDWRAMIIKRQSNAAELTRRLSHLDAWIQLPAIRPDTEHAFMMYPVVVRDGGSIDLTAHLETRGIETRGMLPLINQPAYASWIIEEQYPVSQWIVDGGFYVGCHQDLSADDIDQIVDGFESFYAGRQRRGWFSGVRLPRRMHHG